MVSTRGVKFKFVEGERVLCYEPDPTKAKVLYDSKVLDIITNKDSRGRKVVEYLIHFQGWNSSWDRCVGEEYVLKDTPENRQLQKDLAEKSQLQIGNYLYRKERKKSRKISERVTQSSEDGSCGSPAMEDDDNQRPSSSSEDESSVEDENISIELTQELRDCLEQDHFLINVENRLHKLPAEPNVVQILEAYWKKYAQDQLLYLNERPNKRYRHRHRGTKKTPEQIHRNLNICKEILDGIRIYFDFKLNDILLYKAERGQIVTEQAKCLPGISEIKIESNLVKHDEEQEFASIQDDDDTYMSNENDLFKPLSRRRTLRSHRSSDSSSNGTSDGSHSKAGSSSGVVNSNNGDSVMHNIKIPHWKMLPDHVYSQNPPPPCLVYGATHLTRLFVKFPELLHLANIPDSNFKVMMPYFDSFIDFLNDHREEWITENHYMKKIN